MEACGKGHRSTSCYCIPWHKGSLVPLVLRSKMSTVNLVSLTSSSSTLEGWWVLGKGLRTWIKVWVAPTFLSLWTSYRLSLMNLLLWCPLSPDLREKEKDGYHHLGHHSKTSHHNLFALQVVSRHGLSLIGGQNIAPNRSVVISASALSSSEKRNSVGLLIFPLLRSSCE